MQITLMTGRMDILTGDNKLLTTVAKLADDLPLQWHLLSDVRMSVAGSNDILYELLVELTSVYLGRIEII